jgi:hypothetical protein
VIVNNENVPSAADKARAIELNEAGGRGSEGPPLREQSPDKSFAAPDKEGSEAFSCSKK